MARRTVYSLTLSTRAMSRTVRRVGGLFELVMADVLVRFVKRRAPLLRRGLAEKARQRQDYSLHQNRLVLLGGVRDLYGCVWHGMTIANSHRLSPSASICHE